MKTAYGQAIRITRTAQAHHHQNYVLNARAAFLETGDRVLVRIVAFCGKHKISDRWEDVPYTLQDRPNKDISVYSVKREDGVELGTFIVTCSCP
jgi:hypothetical protein